MPATNHFSRLLRLLELESAAEAERAGAEARRRSPAAAERTGNSLVDLAIIDENTGLGGRTVVTLAKRNRTLVMPWHRLGPGTPVILSPLRDATGRDATARGYRGVMVDRSDRNVQIALPATDDVWDEIEAWRVDLSADEIALSRQRAALKTLDRTERGRLFELREVLLGTREPKFRPPKSPAIVEPSMNASQREAIELALAAEDIALIQGPPGTGKTTTLAEFIRLSVDRGEKVLATAPSNLAVDNLLERLLAKRVKAVRLGHPARVLPELREHTLDLLVDDHPDVRLARKLVKDARALFRQAGRWTRAKPQPGARGDMRQEARQLLADARQIEDAAVRHILDSADVLCATTTGLDPDVLADRHFDLAVIDEACQSTEPGCWLPVMRAERLVLAGDHCQLPPTVVSPEAAAQGFGVSLFERLIERQGNTIARRLETQYRMHEQIMGFSSREFYHAALQAHASVASHLLRDLPSVATSPLTECPVEFIDTAGASYDEQLEPEGSSRFNPQEAELVARRVRGLLEAGVAASDVAVIAPYAAQVRHVRQLIDMPGLEIDTVDGFQGREKEAIIISLVRSNPEGQIGFLDEVRRTNVALTRARRKLIVIGDSATIAGHPFYARLLEYFEHIGAYRSVWEELM
ncbi:MAG TPA: AAA domain-containing protein [Pirellulales bacterium]|jgi:superfamily I DNA and/or RNA helicase|nr:AAA domain-containing protein [Pirellulales bacterium]